MNSYPNVACVLGDIDLLRPLGRSMISCAVAARPGSPIRFSRYAHTVLDWTSPWKHPEQLVETLISFGAKQKTKPVLFYQSDGDLLLVSRNRERLREHFRFVIADKTLVEDLVDKERFQSLAERLSLPVPAARRLRAETTMPVDLNLRYPIVVKPLTRRQDLWQTIAPAGKAIRINTSGELSRIWPLLAASGVTVLAQERIPGPEACIESYHVYVDEAGEIVGEFTGRKIRTWPREYGESTAIITTGARDVAALGRELVHKLGLRGVAKFDFKRAPNGELFLLEINPRFNLWHYLGALAGLNLPALVYGDMVGAARPQSTAARPGVKWCRVPEDAAAARSSGLSMKRWLSWALTCEAKRHLTWDDPMPLVGATLWQAQAWQRTQFAKGKSLVISQVHRRRRGLAGIGGQV